MLTPLLNNRYAKKSEVDFNKKFLFFLNFKYHILNFD